jgi:methylated-DNA-[protein]-cysteine S-methyltransferase
MRRTGSDALGRTVVETELGWVGIAWSEHGLLAVTLPQPTEADAHADLPGGGSAGAPAAPGLVPAALADKLRRYFAGEAVTFDEPLDPEVGTLFQRRVWAATRAIPRGQTRTYGQLAQEVGSARAARAVGQAMARNPWPVVVPCHRVVGRDGRLTGFGGGVALKAQMLALEGAHPLPLISLGGACA